MCNLKIANPALLKIFLCVCALATLSHETFAQRRDDAPTVSDEAIRRATARACAERELDPQGSIPIDELRARPSLPPLHPDVIAGRTRAERLLPLARELAIQSLDRIAKDYRVAFKQRRAALARINRVTTITPDMRLRDNAATLLDEPQTIHFGTLFLAGLRSDEAMLGVLVHELTHHADGKANVLRPLFRRIAARAAQLTNLEISRAQGEELSCDTVAARAVRGYIVLSPNDERIARRMARAFAHNCVRDDRTDQIHLSPRNTMRSLLALDAAMLRLVTGD